MRKILFLVLAFLALGISGFSQGWQNPMLLEDQWHNYGIGDPYILKYRGVYYLYCSTKDWETGIKTYSSKDLITWSYEGLSSTDPITQSAYAPEVVYWNGMFYMYTSPAGNGHFALSSDSPTGPFTAISSNFGKWIDGSVYIDDDASWNFYHASPWGIQSCEMDTPTSFGESLNTDAQMNNSWTEGPCIFKRNGLYYMIYTGNHLRTTGYRIDYATNETGPVGKYTPASSQNPILLNTLGNHVGLGHGTIFIGPDLDSYFLTYHSMTDRGPRQLNFDRIAWNGEKMMLLGSTDFEQQGAALPYAYDYFERESVGNGWSFTGEGRWSIENSEYLIQDTTIAGSANLFKAILDTISDPNFTAEYNFRETFRSSPDAFLGAVFSYTDEENYGIALINSNTNMLEVNFRDNSIWGTPQIIEMPAEMDYTKWHCLRLEKYEDRYKIFFDNMLKISTTSDLNGGKIGYVTNECHGDFGFIAFSNKANGSGVFDVYKPLPGVVDAVLYNQGGEGLGFHLETPGTEPEKIIRSDETVIIDCPRGGYAIRSIKNNDWYKYNVNTEFVGNYNCEVVYASASSSNSIRISIDETDVSGAIVLPSTGGTNQWRSLLIQDLQLPQGYHTLKVEALAGDFNFYSIQFVAADNDPFDERLDFEYSFGKGWEYRDGDWSIENHEAVVYGYGKRTFGSALWKDYTVETDMILTRRMDAGLLFRVNNPAPGGAADNPETDPQLGTNFFQGYSVRFSASNVILYKHNYSSKILTTSPGSFPRDTWMKVRAVLVDDNIRVFVDDMTDPIISYTDSIPFINGMAGYHSVNSDARFDNFHVLSDTLTTSIKRRTDSSRDPSSVKIYPNPVSEIVSIDFTGTSSREIRIRDMNGREIYYTHTNSEHIEITLKYIDPGMYVIQVLEKEFVYSGKLIIQ